ncbi:MAG: hypothetical protein NZ730_11400, partial [Porticoccaceae bacterium]|nr:hypothetical protein [Porticoccaceae bacterium]
MKANFWVLQSSISPFILAAHALKKLQGIVSLTEDKLYYTPLPHEQTLAAGADKETAKTAEREITEELQQEELQQEEFSQSDTSETSEEENHQDHQEVDQSTPLVGIVTLPQNATRIKAYTATTITVTKQKYPTISQNTSGKACLNDTLPVHIQDRGNSVTFTIHNITRKEYTTVAAAKLELISQTPQSPEERTQRIQDRRDAREARGLQGLVGYTEGHKQIIFPEVTQLGAPPFDARTAKFTIFLAYILIVVGIATRLTEKSAAEISQIVNEQPTQLTKKLMNTINRATRQRNLQKLYTQIPRILCAHLHLQMHECYSNIKQSSNKQASATIRNRTKLQLLSNLTKEATNLSLLYYYSQTKLYELCQGWGRHPFFAFTTKKLQIEHFAQIPQVTATINQETIKTEPQLQQLLYPATKSYAPTHTFKEFRDKTINEYDRNQMQADAQIRKDHKEAGYRPHQLTGVRNKEELDRLVKYSRTTTALSDFVADQTGQDKEPRMTPLSEFHKTLKPAKFVNYKSQQEILDDFIPKQIRPEFSAFSNMMSDKQFIPRKCSKTPSRPWQAWST